jgi:diguanylate cyclase (GGDEF)-like protein
VEAVKLTLAEMVSLGVAALALVTSGMLYLRGRRTVGPYLDLEPGRPARLRNLLAPASPQHAQPGAVPRASDLRSESEATYEEHEAATDIVFLEHQLADIRDACGAEEAVFWRWQEHRDSLTPVAWSTAGAARPQHFAFAEWAPLVKWAAESRVVIFDGEGKETPPRLTAAAILDEEHLIGVLTIANQNGVSITRDYAKAWMPRYADQVSRLLALSEMRRQYATHTRRSRALLTAIEQIQNHKTQESLNVAICETALEVSSAVSAALVRWRPDKQKGSVRYTTHGFRHQAPYALDSGTLVANACRDAMPVLIDDMSILSADAALFFEKDGGWRIGSLAVVPLIRHEQVIGAIVVASDQPGRITADEVRHINTLGAVSAASLEIVWEIDEVTRRARIDALTGLSNRRAFDEQFKRLLNETDRFGQPLSLILADIDHFKQINDTWGHEAGDEVLRRVAKQLAEGVRTVDVCARYGGEEIAMLLPQTAVMGAADLADRLRRAIAAKPMKVKGAEIAVTVSFGVASYPEVVATRDGLFRAVDNALYEAKAAGRNCVKVVGMSRTDRGA